MTLKHSYVHRIPHILLHVILGRKQNDSAMVQLWRVLILLILILGRDETREHVKESRAPLEKVI